MKETTIRSFVSGVLVYAAILGFVAGFLDPVLSHLPTVLATIAQYIEAAIVLSLACYIGARRYYLPGSPTRLAYWTSATCAFLEVFVFVLGFFFLSMILPDLVGFEPSPFTPSALLLDTVEIIISSVFVWIIVFYTLKNFGQMKPTAQPVTTAIPPVPPQPAPQNISAPSTS